MPSTTQIYDTHGDLLIRRHKHGIHLVKPGTRNASARNSISNIYRLPVAAYFLNTTCHNVDLNEMTAECLGGTSAEKLLQVFTVRNLQRNFAQIICR